MKFRLKKIYKLIGGYELRVNDTSFKYYTVEDLISQNQFINNCVLKYRYIPKRLSEDKWCAMMNKLLSEMVEL